MNAKPIIVHDEPPIRKLLRIDLAMQGYTAIEAANGKAAIEHMQVSAPTLVILDLGLPEPVRMEDFVYGQC